MLSKQSLLYLQLLIIKCINTSYTFGKANTVEKPQVKQQYMYLSNTDSDMENQYME